MSAMSWGTIAAVIRPPRQRKTHVPLLIVVIVLGLLSGTTIGEKSKKYQMSDVCKKYFMRDLYRKIDGAVLTSQNERELDCAITFQTHSILQRFMLRFDQLQLDCNDHLYIFDGAHAVGSYKIDEPFDTRELRVRNKILADLSVSLFRRKFIHSPEPYSLKINQ